MKKNEILDYININGGITLNNGEKADLKKGYMVSIFGSEYKTENSQEVSEKVNEYLEKIQEKQGLYVGVWLDNGNYYIDYSINILDKTEALEFGKKNKQIAIFDLEKNDSLYLKNYSFNKYYTIYEIVRDANNNIIDYKIDMQKNSITELVDYFKVASKTIRNCIYNELQENYMQVIDGKFIIIKDFELIGN